MKKRLIICLALAMTVCAMVAMGCSKPQAPAVENTPETAAEPDATPQVVVYSEPVNVYRLDSIDYNVEKEQYLLNVTPIQYTFEDAVEAEQSYTTKEGDPTQLELAPEAVVDFPMLEDLAETVTLLPGELTEEYLAFVEEMDDKPLFTAELNTAGQVARLTYFYLP